MTTAYRPDEASFQAVVLETARLAGWPAGRLANTAHPAGAAR
jgi:hypothetical protein